MKVALPSKTAFLKLQSQRKLERSAKLVKKAFESLESSVEAEALKIENFNPAPIYPDKPIPIPHQMRELTGTNLKKADPIYQGLIEKVVPLRKAFRAELTV